MRWVMSMLPIQTTTVFRSFDRPARSFRAAARVEAATESFLDRRTSEQIRPATTTSLTRATIACKSLAPAVRRPLQMQVPIKQLSVPAQPHQSRLMGPGQQQVAELSARTRGLKVQLRSVQDPL